MPCVRRAVALLVLPLALASSPAAGAPASRGVDVLPFPARTRTLANGLVVIVVPTGFPNIVSLHIPVQAGSRNEVEPGKTGFAHFFEHMMFRGTKQYPPEKYQALVTRMGARQNAYTSDDSTNYHITFAKEDLETVLRIEADRFMNLDYPVDAFKTEARAVLGEYNKSAANPFTKLDEAQADAAFRRHPYKHTTMGFLADIEDLPNEYEYSRRFFERWYRPEYTTLVVAGDVDPAQVFRLAEKHWGGWKRGSYRAEIPAEPPPAGPVYAHVPWSTPTLPWVTVAFHGPAFSEREKSYAAVSMLFQLTFGSTSDLYRKLVEEEQKVDALFADAGGKVDPTLCTVYARLKQPGDAVYVRDAILRAFATARTRPVEAQRLEDARSHARYAFVRHLDNTEAIGATVAAFAHHRRSFDTANALHRVYASLRPQDLLDAARRYFTDERLVVTTLSRDPLPETVRVPPTMASLAPAAAAAVETPVLLQRTALPQLDVKLLFEAGSARDPAGKEGLAAIAADMIADAGSRALRIDEIRRALHPLAASFDVQVDKEMVTFTGSFHRDGWRRFFEVALPQLLDPGFREEDFRRVKDQRLSALVQDLRSSNDEELAKEILQANLFAGTPYAHPVQGTVAGLEAVTLDDVKTFVRSRYTRANLTVGVAGDVPAEMLARLREELASLPPGEPPEPLAVAARRPTGVEVQLVEKDTRGTAISFGHPIEVRRGHPDFVALYLARTWFGEHRSSSSHLYQRIRELRGLNYGDYAYIEAFPRGMYQLEPEPNVARRSQIFEVWIRPVAPENAPMAIRIALFELGKLVEKGLSREEFEATRAYLMKNVFLLTSTQEDQLGYALDARYYGTPEFTRYMREGLAKLTVEDVNRAVKRHLSARDLSFAIVTRDARGLAEKLIGGAVTPVRYDGEKPAALLEEDRVIASMKLSVRREDVSVTPLEQVLSR